jgi:outer membrane protein OmpA-like peptidoglycan-associated protein
MRILLAAGFLALVSPLAGVAQSGPAIPLYQATQITRTIPAMNYVTRRSVKIPMVNTTLLPGAGGQALVDVHGGLTAIHLKLDGLIPAYSFGPEYLTYVLWAITPDGRPVNLTEVIPDHKGRCNFKVTTSLQSFGLMVSAEPYFAVNIPSDVVVLQNAAGGEGESSNAQYSVLPRGAYVQSEGSHLVTYPIGTGNQSPLELYEARNAVQIARAAQAGLYAAGALARAEQNLKRAMALDNDRSQRSAETTLAREAVQAAEDARITAERRAREAFEARQRQNALEAQKQATEASLAAKEAAAQQQQAEAEAQAAQQAAQQALQQQQAAEQQAQQAQAQAAAAQRQTAEMRDRLEQQLNAVLATRETARGLIVNMSDVVFATGSYQIKTSAQIKLARIAGILMTYPGLKVQVEGYTDNVGSAAFNQKLSDQRANAVMQFLISQGVKAGSISAKGYGEADPVASNSTASGRAQNRRVQLVVSGAAIGTKQQAPPPSAPPPPANPTGVSNPPQPY